MNYRQIGILGAKLGASGAIIATIAVAFLVFSGDGDVSEVQADIFDLHPAEIHQHGDFERVIEDSGLEPRPYDYNGNHVHFAHGESELTPDELFDYYQQNFKHAGINSDIYETPLYSAMATEEAEDGNEEVTEMADAFTRGEMVPLSRGDDHFAMAGLMTGLDPERQEFQDFKDRVESEDLSRFQDQDALLEHLHNLRDEYVPADAVGPHYEDDIDGFRYIDAQRGPFESTTTVTSTWSDGDFDAHRIIDPEADDVGADVEVPACIGCERDNRLEALDDDEPYVLNQFRAQSTSSEIQSFYERAMVQRDWEPSKTDQGLANMKEHIPELQRIDGDMINFERGDESLTIFVADDPTSLESGVVTMRELERPAPSP